MGESISPIQSQKVLMSDSIWIVEYTTRDEGDYAYEEEEQTIAFRTEEAANDFYNRCEDLILQSSRYYTRVVRKKKPKQILLLEDILP